MKTLSDIRAAADLLQGEINEIEAKHEEQEDAVKKRLFALYDESTEVQALISRLENFDAKGSYTMSNHGELIYCMPVPQDVSMLPLIREYLSKDWASYYSTDVLCGQDAIYQHCGDFISVGCGYDRNAYYVFDHGTMKPIIPKQEKWMTENYVRARIELYQQEKGWYGDVIKTDYYGSYIGHFDMQPCKGLTDKKKLQAFIERIEREAEGE